MLCRVLGDRACVTQQLPLHHLHLAAAIMLPHYVAIAHMRMQAAAALYCIHCRCTAFIP